MSADRTVDIVVLVLTLGLIGCGLLSAAIGRVMSRRAPVPTFQENEWEQRSDAVEQGWEQAGTGGAEHVPYLVEQLGDLDDNELLEVLALIQDDTGYRFAESRIGRFVGGRLEDRIDQVRAVRGEPEGEPPPGRTLKVRDEKGERVISY